MYRLRFVFLGLLVMTACLSATPALAAVANGGDLVAQTYPGLVQCSGPDCNFCTAIVTINNVVEFVMKLAVILATIALAIIGFKMVASQGNPAAKQQAKNLLINFFIGLLLVLTAWMLVDSLLKVLLSKDVQVEYGPWNEIDTDLCGGAYGVGKPTIKIEDIKANNANTLLDDIDYDEQVDSPTAVNLATLPGYSGGRATLPVVAQTAGTISYENGTKLTAYSLSTTQAPYDYSSCPRVAPSSFFKITESANVKIGQYYTVCQLTNCGSSQRAGEYAYLDPRAVAGMDRVAAAMGGRPTINSGYRSPTYNAGVGGATCSQHMAGKAFDIAANGSFSTQQIADICRAAGAGFTKLYNTFTHCDWRQ